jgi:archaeal flagellar protein FlaI
MSDTLEYIDLELRLAEILSGKMNLIQEQKEREELAEEALSRILKEGEFSELKQDLENAENRLKFIQDFLCYGLVTNILYDSEVEDLTINNLKPIYMHHSQRGYVSTEKKFSSPKEIDLFIKKLLLFSGRKTLGKIMDIELSNLEGRANITLSPFGPQITITKAKNIPLSILDLIHAGTLTYEAAAQLWIYMDGFSIRPANIMITGGPGVGKTSLLNALLGFIPNTDHVVVIEDTLELNTQFDESCSRLETDGDITLADLVRNSLRMRPDRIIIGEVRGPEAQDMITACNVGKYCIGTLHALTSREAIIRLQNEPMNIPQILVNLIDVFIVLKRYHVKDKLFRVVDEISETSGMEQVKILLANVYKYNYEAQKLNLMSPSTVYRDILAQNSGMTPREIMKEHALRAFLLETLDGKGMNTIKEISTFCRSYCKDPDGVTNSIGFDRQKLLNQK